MGKRVAILGAGNMGTALAVVASKNAPVVLWSIEPDVVRTIRLRGENPRYLRGVRLPKNVRSTGNLAEAVQNASLVIVAVPSHIVEPLAQRLALILTPGQLVLNAAKGLEGKTYRTAAEILQGALDRQLRSSVATLSGPSIANEFGCGLPCAVTIAARTKSIAEKIAGFLRTKTFCVETSADIRGVALGGTLKNIYALALGMTDGLKLGMNAKAALFFAAVNEMKILITALGAREESVYALSGIGDLIVTGMSRHSRNRRFGEEIAADPRSRKKMRDPSKTIEGVRAVRSIAPFARRKKLRTPILFEIEAVLFKHKKPQEAVKKMFLRILPNPN